MLEIRISDQNELDATTD